MTYDIMPVNDFYMDNKINVDLNLLELALVKAIEVLKTESNLLMKINVKGDELEKIASEKEDVMNFIEWHIPIIVRYIKIHKGDLDDIDDLANLAIRSKAINKIAQESIKPKIENKAMIGNQKISTITIFGQDNSKKPLLDIIFKNDNEDMPKRLTMLLKDMFLELETNFNRLSARKQMNDHLFEIVSQTMKEDQRVSYSPKKKKEVIRGNLIYNEDC